MKALGKTTAFLIAAGSLLTAACSRTPGSGRHIPVTEVTPWKEFVKVKGQALPVPVQWLQTEEARIAHDLMLPDGIERVVPFDFDAAKRKAFIIGPSIAEQYFRHLCDYEAGEWIFERTEPQEGIYDARPVKVFDESRRASVYFYENPHYQLYFRDGPEVPQRKRGYTEPYRTPLSSSHPTAHFRFQEWPTPRDEAWAKDIKTPYLRFRQTQKFNPNSGWDPGSPWELEEISQPTVRYGVTWRGLLRERDREFRIAGSEQLVFELDTKRVLGLRRTFRWMRPGGVEWPGALQCGRIQVSGTDSEWIHHLPERVVRSANEKVPGFRKPLTPEQPLPKQFIRE